MRWTGALLFAALLVPGSAWAANDVLNDADLVTRAAAMFSVKTPPGDMVLGTHKGNRVVVDIRCASNCPADTVRFIRYDLNPGISCERVGGDAAAIPVARGMTVGAKSFCVPHILYGRRLYMDRPYQQ